jgi:hypothetical protein
MESVLTLYPSRHTIDANVAKEGKTADQTFLYFHSQTQKWSRKKFAYKEA